MKLSQFNLFIRLWGKMWYFLFQASISPKPRWRGRSRGWQFWLTPDHTLTPGHQTLSTRTWAWRMRGDRPQSRTLDTSHQISWSSTKLYLRMRNLREQSVSWTWHWTFDQRRILQQEILEIVSAHQIFMMKVMLTYGCQEGDDSNSIGKLTSSV